MHEPNLSFSTGLPGLNHILHGLKPGDNVVLQVASQEDYIPFVDAFYREALDRGQPLIYFRFARHQSLVPAQPGVTIHHLHPEAGFERFISETMDVIEQAGVGACYVFDCLSELAVDWYSDRMLGNFFMLTCPYLYKLDTIAYFALLRNHHSSLATDAITNTAQVVLTVFSDKEELYIQPQKVFNRYSSTMYSLHHWKGEQFIPVTSSAVTSEILIDTPQPWLDFAIHRPGVWTETFMQAREALEARAKGREPAANFDFLYRRLLRMAVTREEQFIELVERYFSLEMLIGVLQRMIGSGLIGGKSLGMLLARAILKSANPEWHDKLEAHDSFFVGSDVFYTYLVQNDCWWLRRRLKAAGIRELLAKAETAQQKILGGVFPEDIQHQFMEMLNYFGQSPIIVRSSSLLEDNYGNAFSGKYESVFCANQGTPEERLAAFMDAVRTVYASTMSRDALSYRSDRGLLGRDEQMALLVQRVSGEAHGGLFYPHIGGVGFSFNPYVWSKELDPAAGLLRIVFGLGTRAVDRSEDDYTRLVALNSPLKQPEASSEDARRYSQRYADVLDLTANRLRTSSIQDALETIPEYVRDAVAVRDYQMERHAREHGKRNVTAYMLNFDPLLADGAFVADARAMLGTLQDAYQNPVDVEFTVNFTEDGSYLINLVQCRPFQVKVTMDAGQAKMPKLVDEGLTVVKSSGPVIGPGLASIIDRFIYVVPAEYSRLPIQDRYAVARLIGQVTHLEGSRDLTIMLIGPGRWGTRSPSLGVPVTFAEINTSSVLCEMAVMHEGLVPDLSLGTHFFNDLVEMDMIYMAVFPEKPGNAMEYARFLEARNRLTDLAPGAARFAKAVRVIDSGDLGAGYKTYLRADPMRQEAVCYLAPE